MRKVINGKMYNTETAEFLGGWSNGYYTNDFHYCSEDLYRTKKGTYFIYGKGGAMSRYSSDKGNGWRGFGSDIRLLSIEEAKAWAMVRLDADDYENIFGDVEEG